MEKGELKENLTRGEAWIRGLYMLLFLATYSVAEVVLVVVVLYQFISRLITNQQNDRLLKLGQQLSTYLYQLVMYFTFNSEERPYPFAAWPRGAPSPAKTRKSTGSTKNIDVDK
jgi:hypothetical protein